LNYISQELILRPHTKLHYKVLRELKKSGVNRIEIGICKSLHIESNFFNTLEKELVYVGIVGVGKLKMNVGAFDFSNQLK
jgi:hypothetical protein